MENPYNLISEILGGIDNRRTQDVIRLRFGLADGQPKTLQEIGDKYNITRERVRQIEENGVAHLSGPKILSRLKPSEQEIHDYLRSHGDLRRESKILDDLVCVCFPPSPKLQRGEPASQLAQLPQKENSEAQLCKAALNLILILGQPFNRISETEDFYPLWTVNKNSITRAKKTVDSAVKYLNKYGQVVKGPDLYQIVKKSLPALSDKAMFSYLDASKPIEQSYFGDFGLVTWPEISPRGVKDKAYLVFKKEGKPLHFSEATNLINQLLPKSKSAYIQTVHNELIKDPRFVLIGRGIYALAEWGYEPGTVVEVISQVLKEKGPLTKEEIFKNVLAKRLIKENTILINLQNKNFFKRLEDGRFSLA